MPQPDRSQDDPAQDDATLESAQDDAAQESAQAGAAQESAQPGEAPDPVPAGEAPAADVVDLHLDSVAHGGASFGRDASGRVVFVQGGLPGEDVTARLTESRERFAHAVLDALPDPASPDRVAEARCAHFGAWPARGREPYAWCGGCQWQHVDYGAQLRFKASVLVDALTRIARIEDPPVLDSIGMDRPWEYRNRVTVRVGDDKVGLLSVHGATVVGVERCHIAHPMVQQLIETLDTTLPEGCEITVRAGAATGDRMVVLGGLGDDIGEVEVGIDASVCLVDSEGAVHLASGRPRLAERLAGRLFEIPALSFFQVNTEMAEVLVRLVRESIPDNVELLADVYSGVGVFAISAADLAGHVVAIEADSLAVAAAADNASGVENLTLLEADAAEGLAYLEAAPDAVIVDPPRTGVDRDTIRLLADMAPHTIVYVSCEPSTLARDAQQLVASGWRLASCQPVDMFPQTFHVESVNVFQRDGSP